MLDVAVMIEGQNGLNWPRWQAIVRTVEDLGFAGLYRSDHYTNAAPPDIDSLELWVSLTWLASHTRRLQFGPLVTPLSFRHPTMTARMAAAVDDLSGGRLQLGLGAGWQAREHHNYGWELLDTQRRFARLEEGLQIITHLLADPGPLDFDGTFYHLREAVVLPRPARPGGPPIVIGGNGLRRTLPLAARFAAEWNAVYIPAARFQALSAELDDLLDRQSRARSAVRRTLMTGLVFGRDEAELQARLNGRSAAELRERGLIVGTAGAVRDQLGQLAGAGVQRLMLQWLDLDDLAGLEALGRAVLE